MTGVWKAVEVAVPIHLSPVEIGGFINAEIHIRASRAGEAVSNVRIGAPRDVRGDFSTWSASYLPAPQTLAA
jgi:hypothetical protein